MKALIGQLNQRIASASLRRKLSLTVELTAIGAILFSGFALFAFQAYSLRYEFQVEMETLTRMVANYAVGPVSFEDDKGVNEVLSGLRARSEVIYAELRDSHQHVLARLGELDDAVRNPGSNTSSYSRWILTRRESLSLHGEIIGELKVQATFRPLFFAALRKFIPVLVLVGAISLAGVTFITRFSIRILLRGLQQLTESAARIASTSDYTVRAPASGDDEIGRLALNFNQMLDQLQASDSAIRASNKSLAAEIVERKRLERALVTSSRLAGMAEIATGVLHNVGNVLNSVNVSAHLLRDKLESSRLRSLERIVDLLAPHAENPGPFFTNDPRGRLVPKFLAELSARLVTERRDLLGEIQSLAGNIDHIKEIVSTQQNYARTAGVNERFDPVELVDDTLRINQTSIERHCVKIRRRDVEQTVILGDRHRVLQILVNLVSNAIHAVKASPLESRLVDISLQKSESILIIRVRDSGMGIAAENLTRIFQHGFTTRPDGHGFGLHSGAIAARALGGSLEVASDGPGLGATFTLLIPFNPVTPPSDATSPPIHEHQL